MRSGSRVSSESQSSRCPSQGWRRHQKSSARRRSVWEGQCHCACTAWKCSWEVLNSGIHCKLRDNYLIIIIVAQSKHFQILEQHALSLTEDSPVPRRRILRLVVKLSERCGIIPPSLSISGVTDCSKEPFAGGGFADIFRASYQGKTVALKRLREFQIHPQRERDRRVSRSLNTDRRKSP